MRLFRVTGYCDACSYSEDSSAFVYSDEDDFGIKSALILARDEEHAKDLFGDEVDSIDEVDTSKEQIISFNSDIHDDVICIEREV